MSEAIRRNFLQQACQYLLGKTCRPEAKQAPKPQPAMAALA